MSRVGRFMIAVVVMASVPALAGETLESIEKKITEQWEKQQSVTAKVAMTQQMEMGGSKVSSTTKGTYEYVKEGDRHMYRSDLTSDMVQEYGEQTMKMSSKILMIDDGEFQYVLTEMDQMPQPMAMKTKSDPARLHGGGKNMFDQMRKEYDLKALPDKTVDGQSVYVIEATSKATGQTPVAKAVYHFRKDTGMPIKIVYLDKDDKTVQDVTYTDVKVNPKIDRERFKFKAPAGVEVMDQTQQG